MESDEVKEFLVHHKRLHPDFAKWSSQLEGEATKAIFAVWCTALGSISIEAAKKVSEALLSGEVEPLEGWAFGRDFNQLGAFIRKHCREAKPFRLSGSCNRTGREASHKCRYCRDTGYRDVFHPNAIDAVVSGRADPKNLTTLDS